jgi:mannan endo-1,4-beta-mannosidase
MMKLKLILFSLLALIFMVSSFSFEKGNKKVYDQIKTVDIKATKETKALYANLKKIKEEGILFGHQDALAYGVHWKGDKKRSDVKDVCGSYPAVYGWDIAWVGNSPYNIDTVDFKKMKKWIRQGYKRGGIITIGWHMKNPKTGGSSWDKTGAISSILPNGEKHEFYKKRLDVVADFLGDLKSSRFFGKPIPIIFRPFHEHTGHWFWWGRPNNTPEEYIALWRFTVDYLKDTKGIHNVLYAYAPDVVSSREHYLECYPGDDYVDILGLDDYHDVKFIDSIPNLVKRLKMVVALAEEKDKVAALTETGSEQIPQDNWWTEVLEQIKSDTTASKIAYMLVWRNGRKDHYYAPFSGHSSAADFQKFKDDEVTLFEDDLPNMYKLD